MKQCITRGLSENTLSRLNNHVRVEFLHEMIYMIISNFFQSINCPYMATLMKAQSLEEREHGIRLINYIYERRGSVDMNGINLDNFYIDDHVHALECAFNEEYELSKLFSETCLIAENEIDFTTREFLRWFIDEQRKEESMMERLLHLVSITDNDYELNTVDMNLPKEFPNYFN